MSIEILNSTVRLGRVDKEHSCDVAVIVELKQDSTTTVAAFDCTVGLLGDRGQLLAKAEGKMMGAIRTGTFVRTMRTRVNLGDDHPEPQNAVLQLHGIEIVQVRCLASINGQPSVETEPVARSKAIVLPSVTLAKPVVPASTEAATPAGAEPTYEEVAEGANPGDSQLSGIKLLRKARNDAQEADPACRLRAMRVCVALNNPKAMALLASLASDTNAEVRRAVFDAALAAGPDGLAIVRTATGSVDPAIAVHALQLLAALRDRAATTRARMQLESDHPLVQAAALRLIGVTGGRALGPRVQRFMSSPHPEVRREALRAYRFLVGEETAPEPQAWWDGPLAQVELPDDPAETGLVPKSSQASSASSSHDAVDLGALLKALGTAPRAEREGHLAPIRALDESAIVREIRKVRPTSEAMLARGAAVAVGELGLRPLVSGVQQLLRHKEAPVRVAAAEALGRQGQSGALAGLSKLLADPEVAVQAAAAVALGLAGRRNGRETLVSRWLDGVGTEDEQLKAALQQARELLEA